MLFYIAFLSLDHNLDARKNFKISCNGNCITSCFLIHRKVPQSYTTYYITYTKGQQIRRRLIWVFKNLSGILKHTSCFLLSIFRLKTLVQAISFINSSSKKDIYIDTPLYDIVVLSEKINLPFVFQMSVCLFCMSIL